MAHPSSLSDPSLTTLRATRRARRGARSAHVREGHAERTRECRLLELRNRDT